MRAIRTVSYALRHDFKGVDKIMSIKDTRTFSTFPPVDPCETFFTPNWSTGYEYTAGRSTGDFTFKTEDPSYSADGQSLIFKTSFDVVEKNGDSKSGTLEDFFGGIVFAAMVRANCKGYVHVAADFHIMSARLTYEFTDPSSWGSDSATLDYRHPLAIKAYIPSSTAGSWQPIGVSLSGAGNPSVLESSNEARPPKTKTYNNIFKRLRFVSNRVVDTSVASQVKVVAGAQPTILCNNVKGMGIKGSSFFQVRLLRAKATLNMSAASVYSPDIDKINDIEKGASFQLK